MKNLFQKIKDLAGVTAVLAVAFWVVFALGVQVYFLANMAVGNDAKLNVLEDELTVKFDGRYVNDPRNIFYEAPEKK